MKDKLANLIDLKSIITIVMVVSLSLAFFQNKVSGEQFVPLVTMILTFYFAKNPSKVEEDKIEG